MKSKLATTIKLLNKTEKEAYKTLTISLFAISFLSIFALRPSLQVITNYRRKLEEAIKVDQILTTKIKNLEKARQNLNIYEAEIKLLNEALPPRSDQSDLLKSLSFLAATSRITVLKSEFALSEDKKPIENIVISLDIKGSIENIYTFLQKTEEEKRYIRINSVIIQKTQGSTDLAIAKISAEVFYTNQDER